MIYARWLVGDDTTDVDSHLLSKVEVDVVEDLGVRLVHHRIVAVVEFEGDSIDEMSLLVWSKGIVKELGLIIVFLELCTANALLDPGDFLRIAVAKKFNGCLYTVYSNNVLGVAALARRNRSADLHTIGPVVDGSRDNAVVALTIPVVIHNWANRSVDGQLKRIDERDLKLNDRYPRPVPN